MKNMCTMCLYKHIQIHMHKCVHMYFGGTLAKCSHMVAASLPAFGLGWYLFGGTMSFLLDSVMKQSKQYMNMSSV